MYRVRGLAAATAFCWTLAIAGGFTTMALLLFGFIYWQTAVHERQRIDSVVIREAQALSATPAAAVGNALDAWIKEDLHDVRYAGLFGPDGRQAGGNLLALPGGIVADGQAHRAVFVGIDRDRDGDDPEVVRAAAWRLSDGRLAVIGYDIDELEDVDTIILRALGLGLAPAVLLSLAAGTILAARGQRRIAALHRAVARIMDGQLTERLPLRGSGDDMDRLGAAVNGMLAEIERLVAEIRGIGDNIAHDLRTPLTRIRTRLERGRDEARTPEAFQDCADRAIASVDQALAVVSAVLRVGEIEHSRRRAAFAPIDPEDIARDAYELYEPLAEEKGMTLRLSLSTAGSVRILGDRDLLLEAAGNLLDNALKFAPAGTVVVLNVSDIPEGVQLSVADSGPGIPPEQRQRVLGRFYRGEQSRTVEGSGLGLSIVAAVMRLHGFGLAISDGRPGCIVSIKSPRHTTETRWPAIVFGGSLDP